MILNDAAGILCNCLYNPHDAVAFEITADEKHIFAGFNFIHNTSKRVVDTANELSLLHLKRVAYPEKLHCNNPEQRNADSCY